MAQGRLTDGVRVGGWLVFNFPLFSGVSPVKSIIKPLLTSALHVHTPFKSASHVFLHSQELGQPTEEKRRSDKKGPQPCLSQPIHDRDSPRGAAHSVFLSWFFLEKVFLTLKQNPFLWELFPLGDQVLFSSNKKGEEDTYIFFLHIWWRRYSYNCFIAQRMSLGGQETSDGSGVNPSLSDSKGLTPGCHSILGQCYRVSAQSKGIWPKVVSGSWCPAGTAMVECFCQKEEHFSNLHCPRQVWTYGTGWAQKGNYLMYADMPHGVFLWVWSILTILALTCFGKECSRIIFFFMIHLNIFPGAIARFHA